MKRRTLIKASLAGAGSTGPFKVAECVSGSHVRFVRNENYCNCDAASKMLLYKY